MAASALENSPLHRVNSGSSDGEHETRSPVSVGSVGSGENERPERMRDWLIRMINSGRFIGLEWLDKEKTIFKVPWIHAKKRGYCRERDAALFREWALHSGKYRQDSDPTVWKINFRCAINGLKDIQEIKDMQTEDCRVYKVYPSRSRRRRRAVRRTAVDPYPSNCNAVPYTELNSQHIYSNYPGMPPYTLPCTGGLGAVSSTEALYSYPPNVKVEYPTQMCAAPSSHYSTIASAIPTNPNVPYPSIQPISVSSTNTFMKQVPYTNSYKDSMPQIFGHPVPPTKSSCPPSFGRIDSPDSGINVEVQNSPLAMQQNSPLTQENSPLAQNSPGQNHSPYQSYSPIHQSHSPIHQTPSPIQSNSPPPLLDEKPFSTSISSSCSVGMGSPNAPSPSMSGSPCHTETDVNDLLSSLENNNISSPVSPEISPSQLQVRVFYGSIPVLTEYINCSKGCHIFSNQPLSNLSPEEKATRSNYSCESNLVLPENHPQGLSKDIFNAMVNGIVLDVNDGCVYVTPLCRTIVYCSNSPTPGHEAVQLNKDQATKVFDYHNHFRPALEHYALIQGESPSPYFWLGLGQNWGRGRHVTQNLISIMVTHVKAKHDIDTIGLPDILATEDLMGEIPTTIDIDQPTNDDLEADAFLRNLQEISN